MNSIYILDTNPLSGIWFTNIFTHLVGGLFILLMISFAMWKLFSLMWSACLFLLLLLLLLVSNPKIIITEAYVKKLAQTLSCVQLFVTPWTAAHQSPLSMEFSRQKYWNGLPFPPPGDLPHPGIEPASLASPALAGNILYHWEAQAQSFLVGVLP